MPHYWRGLFDGDGSLARKSADLWTVFLCGSEPCVRGFKAWAAGVCGTRATPYFNTGCWYVSISGRFQVPKIVRALYEDAPVSLDRKQQIADRIMEAPELSSPGRHAAADTAVHPGGQGSAHRVRADNPPG